jgi:hypothetical protein
MNKKVLFKGTEWNPLMWKHADHEFNPEAEWNIAHVRNAIVNHGCVPPDRIALSGELLDALLSNHINISKDFRELRDVYRESRAMHEEVEAALKDDNLLRAAALLEDWRSGHRKWTTLALGK